MLCKCNNVPLNSDESSQYSTQESSNCTFSPGSSLGYQLLSPLQIEESNKVCKSNSDLRSLIATHRHGGVADSVVDHRLHRHRHRVSREDLVRKKIHFVSEPEVTKCSEGDLIFDFQGTSAVCMR